MSLEFIDGMYYATDDLLFKYSYIDSGFVAMDAVKTRRSGVQSIEVTGGQFNYHLDYSPNRDLPGVFMGFAFNPAGITNDVAAAFWLINLNGVGLKLRLMANYSFEIYDSGNDFLVGSDPAVVDQDVWAFVEFGYVKHATTGSVTVKVNEITVAEILNQDFDLDCDKVQIGTGFNADMNFQDLYICSGDGVDNNTFRGDSKVDIIRPSGVGTNTDFSPSAGANWQNVDEFDCDEDVTYNQSDVVGAKDSYDMETIAVTGAEIFGIQQQSIVRKTDASLRYGKQLLISGATEDLGDELQFSDSYVGYQRPLDLDPDTGVAWTESGVNSLESGLTVTT